MRIAAPTTTAAHPLPRCPPPNVGLALCAFRLDRRSTTDLSAELKKQQLRLCVA